MESTDTNRGEEATRGGIPPKFNPQMQFKPRRSDRRGEGGLFGGYNGPERRSGSERRGSA